MNREQIEGKWEQLKGRAKEKWAKLTDNDLLEIRGKSEVLKGKLRERYGYSKEEIEDEVSDFMSGSDADSCGCSDDVKPRH